MACPHNWWPTLGVVLVVGMTSSGQQQDQVCESFRLALDGVPHTALTSSEGPIESVWTREPPAACEVTFETTDAVLAGAAVPDFVAEPGSTIYEAGWRTIPEIVADGAGSGVYGIQRNGVRCVIRWEQPAYVDDDGTIVQSDTFNMLVQCSGRELP